MLTSILFAALQLNPLFGDHAVVQRDTSLTVWGRGGKPGERLTLAFAGTNCWTKVNPDGTFRFLVPPRPAGGPWELSVTAESGESAVAKDLLVGEVWIASGQSNMAFTMGSAEPGFGDVGDDALRSFRVPDALGFGERTEACGKWVAATPQSVKGFSAVGAFFARALRRELGVPVGLLFAANGGTRIEAWSSKPALAETESGRVELGRFAAGMADPRLWNGAKRKPEPPPEDPGPTDEALGWAKPDFQISGWRGVMAPSNFSDLEGRDFNGAVWYVRDVTVPENLRGRDLVFRIPGADKHDRTYVNGTLVGETGKGQETACYSLERAYRVPAALIGGDGKARLAIRVWSQIYAGGLGTADGPFALAPAEGKERPLDLCGFWKWRIERDFGRVGGGTAGYIPGNANAPHALFDAKIAPLVPYAIRGAIWYQGESNENNPQAYRDLLAAMVRDWRHRWAQGDFPFIAAQLAGFGYPSDFHERSPWAQIRQAMLDLSLTDPNFGIASAVDVGNAGDIHPKDKLTVGERMAKWALNRVYGRSDVLPTGPRAVAAERKDGKAVVRFLDCGTGLKATGELKGFYVKDAEGLFHVAKAEISGPDTVSVSAADCPAPVEVNYCWSKNPGKIALMNSGDLPASPFRIGVR